MNQRQIQTQTQSKTDYVFPMVSVCTPTFNRRPFYPMIIECFNNQDYPKDRIEWIIIDDGTDKIGDLVCHIPQVKYFPYEEKMSLGKKRNLMHDKCSGDIIVYMDDDDYYPNNRISHAVKMLEQNPTILCAGSSEIYIYFNHINKMYKFGPYGRNHSTAASFAFRKELLNETRYDDLSELAEETIFLKNYTIPIIQLDPLKTILVFSHIQNSFDKKTLLIEKNPYINESDKKVTDFIKEKQILKFFLEDIDEILKKYSRGGIEHKPNLIKQMEEIKKTREDMVKQEITLKYEQHLSQLTMENIKLKDQNEYLQKKITELIQEKITSIKTNKPSI